jgi:hypothetical protein
MQRYGMGHVCCRKTKGKTPKCVGASSPGIADFAMVPDANHYLTYYSLPQLINLFISSLYFLILIVCPFLEIIAV